MLKWLKDSFINALVFEVRQNARRYDLIIGLLRDQAKAAQILDGKVNIMSSAIDRIEKEATDLAENVPIIKQAVADLKTVIKDLQDQIAQGQLDQARLDAAASKLAQVDDDTDAIFAPEPTPEPQPEG